MGIIVRLVNVTPNEIVYLIDNMNGGESGTPPGTASYIAMNGAGGFPFGDLVDACVDNTWGRAASAKLRQVCNAGVDGLGSIGPSAWTLGAARDLFGLSGATPAGSPLMPRAEIDIQPVNGVAGGCLCEATVSIETDNTPRIDITTAAVVGQAILRVRLRSSPAIR